MTPLVRPRLFSLREANAFVPLLKDTFTRARELRDKLAEAQRELAQLGQDEEIEPSDIVVDPLAPPALRAAQARARGIVEELMGTLQTVTELGIEVKAADGLVDFRSRHEGRTVYLCWRFGEDRIEHFHDLEAGFAGRKPLPPGGEFAGDLLH